MPSNKATKKKHPWRACPYGQHWRNGSRIRAYVSNGKRVRAHVRRGTCVTNESRRDQIYPDELSRIAIREFKKLAGPPYPDDLGYRNGNDYDELIRGWTKYWNEVLDPKPALDGNLVKALIATESSFISDNETKFKNLDRRAYGLMQVLGISFKILADEKGEIRDHYINVNSDQFKSPSINIAVGVRWLIHKHELLRKKNPKATWIETVAKYKSYPIGHPQIKKLEKLYHRLSTYRPPRS